MSKTGGTYEIELKLSEHKGKNKDKKIVTAFERNLRVAYRGEEKSEDDYISLFIIGSSSLTSSDYPASVFEPLKKAIIKVNGISNLILQGLPFIIVKDFLAIIPKLVNLQLLTIENMQGEFELSEIESVMPLLNEDISRLVPVEIHVKPKNSPLEKYLSAKLTNENYSIHVDKPVQSAPTSHSQSASTPVRSEAKIAGAPLPLPIAIEAALAMTSSFPQTLTYPVVRLPLPLAFGGSAATLHPYFNQQLQAGVNLFLQRSVSQLQTETPYPLSTPVPLGAPLHVPSLSTEPVAQESHVNEIELPDQINQLPDAKDQQQAELVSLGSRSKKRDRPETHEPEEAEPTKRQRQHDSPIGLMPTGTGSLNYTDYGLENPDPKADLHESDSTMTASISHFSQQTYN